MLVTSPKYRKPLSKDQILLLNIICKFRFVSTDLVAALVGKDKSTVYERLYVLEKQGYVVKVYDKSYKLLGKPATYCLSTATITMLRKLPGYDDASLRNMYKNKSLFNNHQYVAHCLAIIKVYLALKRHYGTDTFDIFSKFELAQYPYFLKPRPGFYLRRKRMHSTKPNSYMLDIIDEHTSFYERRKRIKAYMEHMDSGEWEPDGSYPSLLFVAPNKNIQAKLIKEVAYNYDRYYINEDETKALVTTVDQLTTANIDNKKVWRVIYQDEDEIVRVML